MTEYYKDQTLIEFNKLVAQNKANENFIENYTFKVLTLLGKEQVSFSSFNFTKRAFDTTLDEIKAPQEASYCDNALAIYNYIYYLRMNLIALDKMFSNWITTKPFFGKEFYFDHDFGANANNLTCKFYIRDNINKNRVKVIIVFENFYWNTIQNYLEMKLEDVFKSPMQFEVRPKNTPAYTFEATMKTAKTIPAMLANKLEFLLRQ